MVKKIDATIEKVYEFLKNFQHENGYPPSVREICENLQIKSTASVYFYLNKLEENGKISKSASKNRAIEIIEKDRFSLKSIKKVPLIGKVACGTPSLAFENIEEFYPLPSDMFRADELFMLTASGDSMIEAGINSGDKLIVKKQNNAENGDIVVALLDNESTVKRFYKKKDHFILHPENINMKDILVNDVVVLGVVVGLLRKF